MKARILAVISGLMAYIVYLMGRGNPLNDAEIKAAVEEAETFINDNPIPPEA